METIVVGVDRSHGSRAAASWGGSLAAALGAELVAVNAFVSRWEESTPEEVELLFADLERDLAERGDGYALETGAKVRTLVREGDPRDVIGNVADDEAADLVVLGRVGEGAGPGLWHVGSVAEYAAHHWSRPLAVVPSGPGGPLERIVVGVDGSAGSLAAVRWCVEVAGAFGASVVAACVQEPFIEWTPASSPENWRREAERRLATWTAPLSEARVEVEPVVTRDLRPADALLGVASAHRGDVLVLGMRGVGGFTGLRAGGVALKVLHRAHLPVVLVPEAA